MGTNLRLALAFVAVGFCLRSWMLAEFYADQPTVSVKYAQAIELARADPTVVRYRFSAEAPVLLGCGKDGQPGVRGHDDNRNGRTDERNEMGAVGSDDVCLAPFDEGYQNLADRGNAMVISRGSFVRCRATEPPDRWLSRDSGWVIGER